MTYHALGGWRDLSIAAMVGAVVLLVGTLPFSFGWIGGGDVKLIAACACALEWPQIAPLLLYTALGGGVVAAIVFVLRKLGKVSSPVQIPYAVAIAVGVAWLGLSSTLVPWIRIV